MFRRADVDVVGRWLFGAADGALSPGSPLRFEVRAGLVRAVTAFDADRRESRREVPVLGGADAIVVPGLSDCHLHLVATAASLSGRDLASDHPGSIESLLERLGALARRGDPDSWLRVSGFEETRLVEGRFPTVAELDRAVRARPLRLRHATRHASMLNSAARLRRAEALGETDRGEAAGDAGLGERSSAVFGRETAFTAALGPHDPAALREGLRAASEWLARRCVTCLDEVTGSNDPVRVALLAEAVARGDVRQRVRVFVPDADLASAAREAAAGMVEIVGVKLFAHDADEAAAPGFAAAVQRARRAGLPIAVHAVEPDVVARVIEVLDRAPRRLAPSATSPGAQAAAPVGAVPDRIEHASLCPPELARRIAAAGVAVVTQPGFLRTRGSKYRREVEEALWPWLYPLRTLREAGVLVAVGSDAPVGPLDPVEALVAMTTRRTAQGEPVGLAEALAPSEAWQVSTEAPRRLRAEPVPAPSAGAPADLVLLGGAATAQPGWNWLRAADGVGGS